MLVSLAGGKQELALPLPGRGERVDSGVLVQEHRDARARGGLRVERDGVEVVVQVAVVCRFHRDCF